MANESKPGYKGKVTLGANNVLGMGTWTWSGFSADMLDDTEFEDDYDDFSYGLLHGGTISFNGRYKKDDTQGQDLLRSAMLNRGNLTDIRFYVDSVSYYIPNSTTAAGGGVPAGAPVAHVKVESLETSLDKGDLGNITFNLRLCNGPMRLI